MTILLPMLLVVDHSILVTDVWSDVMYLGFSKLEPSLLPIYSINFPSLLNMHSIAITFSHIKYAAAIDTQTTWTI